jgi:ubiquinone/menaquinone biosynthesis C-methylase UbiE
MKPAYGSRPQSTKKAGILQTVLARTNSAVPLRWTQPRTCLIKSPQARLPLVPCVRRLRANCVMTFAYHSSDVHARYDAGRALSAGSIQALMEWLAQHVERPVRLVVDLGCGTGRFTVALCEAFAAPVVGVEPAANMRLMAEGKPHPSEVRFVQGSAGDIPLGAGSADLVFMSQVFHHLVDRAGALREIHRVLAPRGVLRAGGRLCLRQTTKENLDSYFYQRFFPEARAVDERRLPTRDALIDLACACGYSVVAEETIRYEVAATGTEYVAKIATRAYSDLECISDESFCSGLDALRSYAAAVPDFPRLAENDVFVFCRMRD